MKLFWWFNKPNYGDVLTPHILKHFGVKHHHVPSVSSANAIMIGSIAKFARKGLHVYGAGFMRKADPVCKDARWHWVRGPHSRDMILKAGGSCPEFYGDPAMVLPLMWKASEKIHDVGIVPHYVDYQRAKTVFKDYPIVNLVTHDCKKTTAEITSCRKIISSSLHGVIVAHAYGIPAAWVPLSDKLNGDGIKFRDHYASLGLVAEPSTIDNPVFTTGLLDADELVRGIQS